MISALNGQNFQNSPVKNHEKISDNIIIDMRFSSAKPFGRNQTNWISLAVMDTGKPDNAIISTNSKSVILSSNANSISPVGQSKHKLYPPKYLSPQK